MAKRGVGETKKHIARAQRERQQRKWILTTAGIVGGLLLLVLGYGIYDTAFVQPFEAVAVVNGETITAREFEGRVRLLQRELLSQLTTYLQMESFFGSDPEMLQELRNVQLQVQTQLANPELLGRDVLDSLILQRILEQEASRRGVAVSQADLDAEVQRNFAYFPAGTPTSSPSQTPAPTITINPEILALLTPTATASPGPTPTVTPTSLPRPTATAYTIDAYQQDYDNFINSLDDFRIAEEDFLAYIEIGLLEARMRSAYNPEVAREEEQVFVQVIFTETEDLANQVLERIAAGESWAVVAFELSQDPSTRANGGEIGWITSSELIQRYGEPGLAAFAAPLDEVVGPFTIETGGSLLFRVTAREQRPISDQAYQLAVDQAFDAWLRDLRNSADVTIMDDWQKHLPPAVPLSS